MFGLGLVSFSSILAIVLIIFGAKRLPQLGAGVGGMLHGFLKAVRGGEHA